MRFVSHLAPGGDEGHAYGAGGPWSWNLLVVLLVWLRRLATIVSPREFDPTLTSYRTHRCTSNFPTNGTNCKVMVFWLGPATNGDLGPTDPV